MQNPIPADLEGRLILDSVHARLFGDERSNRIGKYLVVRRIGSGAMGDVYLGWDEDLDRSVAIKLVHPAAQDRDTDRKRLVREAQALARLTHDNVIRVYESGTHDGRVYVAMEYVKGTTLGAWQKGKTWRELLGAYIKAGRGLDAAHAVLLDDDDRPTSSEPTRTGARHGLVHRDFKPDNVLIGDDGRVRVADFGLAVPLDRAQREATPSTGTEERPLDLRLTASHAIMGTPLYVSPEQLAGKPADARSDQFTFCVALYEALYGQHPFYAPDSRGRGTGAPTDSEGPERTAPPHIVLFDAILHAPLRVPPRGNVPRRIFATLARGLERDPGKRYPAMAALLADLERDPRRRSLWALGGAVTLGLSIGLAYDQMQPPAFCVDVAREVAGLWDDAVRDQVRAAFVATGAPYASTTFQAVDRTLRDYLDAWTHSREGFCDATYVHGTQDHTLHERNMACLDQRRALLRSAFDELARVDADTIAGAVDRMQSLPRIDDCDARLLLRQTCTVEPRDPASASVREAIQAARTAELAGRYVRAEPVAAAAVAAARALGVASLTAEAHFIHGRILAELSRPEAAREALLAALDLSEGAECEALAAEIGTWIAKLVALNPDLDTQLGIDWSRYSFAKLRRLGDDHLRRASALSDRGLLRERRTEDYAAAEQDYREALELRERDRSHTTVARAINHLNLGAVLARQHRLDEAIAAFGTSLDLYRQAYGDGHPNLWRPLFNLGVAAQAADRFADAEKSLTQSLVLAESAFGPNHRKVLEAHNALAALYIDHDDGTRAQEHARVASTLCDQEYGPADRLCLALRRQLAHSHELLDQFEEALPLREQVLAAMRADGDIKVAEAHLELAGNLARLERWQPALEHADAALAMFGPDPGDARVADASLYRGDALLHLGRPAEAIAPYEHALTAWKNDPEMIDARASAHWGLARSLCGAGREPDRARELARDARDSFAADPNPEITLLHEIDAWLNKPCRPSSRR